MCALAVVAVVGACSTANEQVVTAPPEWGSSTGSAVPAEAAPLNQATTPSANWRASTTQAPDDGPAIEWRTAYRSDAVEVSLLDPRNYYRVQQVTLLGPGGRAYPAAEITRNVVRDRGDDWYGGPSVGFGGAFGSRGSALGVGLGFSFPPGGRSARAEAASATTTDARIPVPEAEQYGRTAQSWSIEVSLIDASGTERFARLPAPLPRG